MGLFVFSNRRRAKDSIMLIAERYGTDGTTVFVRESLVYVDIGDSIPDIATIMHYAQACTQPIEDLLKLEEVEELYKNQGIKKFRV